MPIVNIAERTRTALLVIDVQHGLFATTPAPYQAAAVIERINALSAHARSHAVPVIFIQHVQPSDGLLAGSAAWALDARLQVQAHDIRSDKTTPDSFLRTSLEQTLATLGVRHLVLCGYATEFCVDTTVRRAAALGYDMTLAADAHTSHDKPHASGARIREHHNATWSSMRSFGVRIEAIDSAAIDWRHAAPASLAD